MRAFCNAVMPKIRVADAWGRHGPVSSVMKLLPWSEGVFGSLLFLDGKLIAASAFAPASRPVYTIRRTRRLTALLGRCSLPEVGPGVLLLQNSGTPIKLLPFLHLLLKGSGMARVTVEDCV